MSFVKGNYYTCHSNSGPFSRAPLTVGQVYRAEDVVAGGTMMLVLDDYGQPRWCDDSQFSTVATQPGVAPSVVAAHAAAKAAPPTPARKAVVTKTGAICSCGKQAERKVFSTFEYWYCPACKTEVGGKAAEAEKDAEPFDLSKAMLAAFKEAHDASMDALIYGAFAKPGKKP